MTAMPEPEWQAMTAAVTGASSGIGRAIAMALLERGVRVAAIGRDLPRLKLLEPAAAEPAGQLTLHQADLSQEPQVLALAADLMARHPRLNILVHCAGIIHRGALEQASALEMDAQYLLNMRAPYVLTQRLAPSLIANQGQVVCINSSAGVVGRGGVASYAGTKHGLRAIADSLREELGPRGVRVLSVFPGQTATPLQAALYAAERTPYHPEQLLQPEDVAKIVVAAVGLPRSAEVTDIHIRPSRKPAS
jgi:short-subunit dehydrogenase